MVHTTPSNYDDCKWQICTPTQYLAAKELHEYEENLLALEGDNERWHESMKNGRLNHIPVKIVGEMHHMATTILTRVAFDEHNDQLDHDQLDHHRMHA